LRISKPARNKRVVPGIEPRTSRTLSENHTTRPNNQYSIDAINTSFKYAFP
jgi:hypothetical protein